MMRTVWSFLLSTLTLKGAAVPMSSVFYDLVWLFFLYSFAGWLLEVLQAAVKRHKFVNRGLLNLPLCPIYGTVAVSYVIFLGELKDQWFFLLLGGMILSAFVELLSGKLLEAIFHRKWWDYSQERFQFEGYICLKYTVIWGLFALLCMKLLNPLLLSLGHLIPALPRIIILWVLIGLLVADLISSSAAILQLRVRIRRFDALGEELGSFTDRLGNALTRRIQRRMMKAYPNLETEKLWKEKDSWLHREKAAVFAQGCGFYKLTLLFFIGAFLGDIIETIFCYVTAGVLMSRSSVVYGPFSIVWGLGCVLFTAILYRWRDKSDRYIFLVGTIIGGAYEYACSVFTELVFGTVFWDYSHIPFNLGGRINLLYCFFWGIAAVLWLKVLFPPLSNLIEKLPMKTGKLLTWVLVVFMVFNMAMSSLALARYTERNTLDQPSQTPLGDFLDDHFPDERVERIYPNAIIVDD